MERLRFAFFFAMCFFPLQTMAQQTSGYYPQVGPGNGPEGVSLIQLIANPQFYDQKRVRLIGYLHLEFKGNAIYFHRDDFEFAISQNAVWVNLPEDITAAQKRMVNDHYVICTARFAARNHGHLGMFAGELDDVTRLEVWPATGGLPPPPPPRSLK